MDTIRLTPLDQCKTYQYQWIWIEITCVAPSLVTTTIGAPVTMQQTPQEITLMPVLVLVLTVDRPDTSHVTACSDTKPM
jgi:hypothetical protein